MDGFGCHSLCSEALPALQQCIALEHLDLSGTGVDELSAIAGLPIKTLRLARCGALEDDALSVLGELSSLAHLDLSWNCQMR